MGEEDRVEGWGEQENGFATLSSQREGASANACRATKQAACHKHATANMLVGAPRARMPCTGRPEIPIDTEMAVAFDVDLCRAAVMAARCRTVDVQSGARATTGELAE